MPQSPMPKERHPEGELYKIVELHGRTFSLYYGYYEECDRQNPLCEPIPIYPDFVKEPIYTKEGYPFATDMQDVCQHFNGKAQDDCCYGCLYYERGHEFIGVCRCERNRQNE